MNNSYVKTKLLDINLEEITKSCNMMHNFVKQNFGTNPKSFSGTESVSTQVYTSYNLLMYPLPGYHELYFEIKKYLYELLPESESKYYIQSWLNYYQKNEYIEWHSHWEPSRKTWHGFFCVDVEPSYTSYQIPNISDILDIECKNNLLVIFIQIV